MTTPVSFELAKLLKEKGFALYCTSLYTEDGKQNDVGNYNGVDDDNYISYSRPTHALATKWIRENFGIHIYATQVFAHNDKREDYLQSKGFTPWITVTKNNTLQEKDTPPCMVITYNSPEEATEAALLYTLKNLIK